MKKKTKRDSIKQRNMKIILAALGGMVFIASYFFLIMQSQPIQLLRPQPGAEQADIISKAESLKRQLLLSMASADFSQQTFTRDIDLEINNDLFKYAQYHKEQHGKFPDLAVANWRLTWRGNTRSMNSIEHGGYDVEIAIDFNGLITEFKTRKENYKFAKPTELTEDDALIEAKSLLESLNINTGAMVIVNKEISQTNANTTFTFTLKNQHPLYPHLTDNYFFEILGDRIIHFKKNTVVNFAELEWQKQKGTDLLDKIIRILIFTIISIIVIIVFIKKLRRDELEFKWATRLGLLTGVVIAILIIISLNFKPESFLAAALAGGFTFLGIFIIYSVSEALSREIRPEKLAVVDLIFQFKGAVRETGAGILRTYLLVGSSLLMLGILFLTTSMFGIGYLSFKSKLLNVFLDTDSTLALISNNIVVSLLIGCLFLIFWSTFLKKALDKHPKTYILLLAITFDLLMSLVLFIDPPILEILLVFPVALLWAYAIQKWDHFTIMFSFFWTGFLLDLTLIFVIPSRVFSASGIASFILLILIFIIGVYLLFRGKSAKDYSAYVPEYVNRIAEKERFLKELEIARGVQMRFLPQKVPQSPSLEIVSLCQPAMEVGGDYFDFVQIDNRYMTVLIGDVSGKGVSAAFYMTMVKGIIKTLSKKTLKPSTLLSEANEIFYENAPRDVFVTIIYGIFDLTEKTLTIASAGHNPLILWRTSTKKTELINPRGFALGLVKKERYESIIEETCIPINEKDVFVFYTDGVSESMNEDNDIFGEDRLREVIETYAHLSPQQLQEKIVNAVAQFSGKAPQHDDFTMVVVKVRPQ